MTRARIVAYALMGAASLAACHGTPAPETSAAPAPSPAPSPAAAASGPEVPPPAAPAPGAAAAAVPAGGLNDMLTSQLGLTPEQAKGGVGSILSYAQGKLPAADFDKVAAAIPGGADAAKAAGPISDQTGLTSAFSKLGISPEQANQLIPAVTQYVSKVAGPQVGQLLGGVFPH
jgi:hypothetical protein